MHPSKALRQTLFWGAVLAVGLAAVSLVAAVGYLSYMYGGPEGKGSPEEAARLRAIVEPINDPEAGRGCDPEYESQRLRNGEWVLGIGRDSHGPRSRHRGGGTLVVKDSRGRVRCFFGHVCGYGIHAYADGSLDEYYKSLAGGGFTEYQWP